MYTLYLEIRERFSHYTGIVYSNACNGLADDLQKYREVL